MSRNVADWSAFCRTPGFAGVSNAISTFVTIFGSSLNSKVSPSFERGGDSTVPPTDPIVMELAVECSTDL